MKKRLFILLAVALTVLMGCERRELEYGSATVNLKLKLNLKVRVNGKVENMPEPEMMRVM